MKWFLRLQLALIAFTPLIQTADGSVPARVRISWNPVRGASYYEGNVIADGKRISFRSRDNSLVFPEGTILEVAAYGADGKIIRSKVTTSTVMITPTPSSPPPVAAPSPPEEVPEELPDWVKPGDDGPDEFDASIPDASPDEIVAEQQKKTVERPDTLQRPKFSSEQMRLRLLLGIGNEKVSGDGGSSKFSGDSGIGSTTARGSYRDNSKSSYSPWSLGLELSGHRFGTTVSETSSDDTETESKLSLIRFYGAAIAMYDIFHGIKRNSKSTSLQGGVGIVISKSASLKVADIEAGSATPRSVNTFGPLFALNLHHELTSTHELDAQLALAPFLVGGAESGSIFSIYGAWQFMFHKILFSELGIAARQESVTADAGCPADASGCTTNAKTKSTSLQMQIGIGARFQ